MSCQSHATRSCVSSSKKHFQPAAIEQQIDLLAALIEPAALADNGVHKARFKRSLDARERGMTGNG